MQKLVSVDSIPATNSRMTHTANRYHRPAFFDVFHSNYGESCEAGYWLDRMNEPVRERRQRIERIRQQIRDGSYDTGSRINAVLERIYQDL